MIRWGSGRRSFSARRSGVKKAAFNPLTLSPTVWYDPGDITTLFQDSAGTTPVTASGQPVGKMLDKSGNGYHATQATSTLRPIYTVSSGNSYLVFDGVDDELDFPVATITLAAVGHTLAMGYQKTGTNYAFGGGSASTNGPINILHAVNAPRLYCLRSGGTVDLTSSISLTGDKVVRGMLDRAGLSHSVFVDGASGGSAVATNTDLSNASSTNYSIGGANAAPFGGNIHGVILLNRLVTGAEAAKIDTYLGAKQGRVL